MPMCLLQRRVPVSQRWFGAFSTSTKLAWHFAGGKGRALWGFGLLLVTRTMVLGNNVLSSKKVSLIVEHYAFWGVMSWGLYATRGPIASEPETRGCARALHSVSSLSALALVCIVWISCQRVWDSGLSEENGFCIVGDEDHTGSCTLK